MSNIVKAHTDALTEAFAAVADITAALEAMRAAGPVDWSSVGDATHYAETLKAIADMAMNRGEFAKASAA